MLLTIFPIMKTTLQLITTKINAYLKYYLKLTFTNFSKHHYILIIHLVIKPTFLQ